MSKQTKKAINKNNTETSVKITEQTITTTTVIAETTQVANCCPECGTAAVIFQESCFFCYNCGYSKCS